MSLDKKEKPKMYKCIFQGADGKMHLGAEIFPVSDAEQAKARRSALRKIRIEYLENALITLALFIGITIWLNAVQSNWPMWSVWILTAIQLLMYLAISETCYGRFGNLDIEYYHDFKFYTILGIFTLLGIIARIQHLELFIVPAIVTIFLIISGLHNTNKNITYGG